MLSVETNETKKGLGIHARRALAYIVLVIMSFLCLFWFYILFVNATRSKGELTQGFTLLPSTHLIQNWKGVMAGTLPIVRGMINSLVVATCSAVLCTYFSTMTAYAIHVYDFKLKKFMFTFILAIMTIPTQVTALGFIQLVADMKLEDNFIPLIIPAIAAPATFFYMKQYMESALPLSLVEAARIDGSGEFRTFNSIVLPLMKPAIAVQAIFTFVANWNNLESITAKLLEIGCEVEEADDCIRVVASKPLQHTQVKTLPYPGFPTDMQPQITVALGLSKGTSIVTESIFENPFKYVDELTRMGASIKVEGNTAIIDGVSRYTGANISAPDLRAGAALVLAAMSAEGFSTVDDIRYIERGYEDFHLKLQGLGAQIELVETERDLQKFKLKIG